MDVGGVAGRPGSGVGRFVYVLDGTLTLQVATGRHTLAAGGYAYVPAATDHALIADTPARACIIDKPYVPVAGAADVVLVVGTATDRTAEPMLGDPALRVRQLLPEQPELDLAVNLMRFDPGAALPFVETHVMEHGLLVLEGTLVYRLADSWYPVAAGDAIWMGPFCPQWCCAYGPGPAEYLIYKDWNRDVQP
jgi:(S)-ureidoglycine aminohydrolase